MGVKLWEIASLINDARDCLGRAADDCVEASGYIPSRAYLPNGDPGDPGEPGWQAMLDLSDALEKVADQLEKVIPDEIREAIEQERQHDDEMSDKADGLSY
jgi:Spy/CpxP family protein refolding chaperone